MTVNGDLGHVIEDRRITHHFKQPLSGPNTNDIRLSGVINDSLVVPIDP